MCLLNATIDFVTWAWFHGRILLRTLLPLQKEDNIWERQHKNILLTSALKESLKWWMSSSSLNQGVSLLQLSHIIVTTGASSRTLLGPRSSQEVVTRRERKHPHKDGLHHSLPGRHESLSSLWLLHDSMALKDSWPLPWAPACLVQKSFLWTEWITAKMVVHGWVVSQ